MLNIKLPPYEFSKDSAEKVLSSVKDLMSRFCMTDMSYDLYLLRRKYLENMEYYLRVIKDVVKEIDKDSRVILFGSYVRGNFKPDSDVDILIITDKAKDLWDRVRIISKLDDNVGRPNIFEFHVVTEKEYREWYSKFIDKYVEL